MVFHSVRAALVWYMRSAGHDGVRSIWPTPGTLIVHHAGDGGRAERLLVVLAIEKALQQLPAAQRRLLILHYLQDVPILDLAAEWRRHPSTIYGRLHRASGRLAERLRAEGVLRDRD
jgi:DNA-directed RNA polymerase specialized sigma24 family protein